MKKVAVVTGVGPGLGASLARKFAREGCAVALLARSSDYVQDLSKEIVANGGEALGIPTDVTDSQQVSDAFSQIRSDLGETEILINHAGNAVWKPFNELTVEEFQRSWNVCSKGAFLCSQEALRDMVANGKGSILFTGATSSIRGRAGGLAFSSAKFAVRGLADSLAREFWPKGIHIAHIIIDGVLDTEMVRSSDPNAEAEPLIDTDEAAESYWMLTQQKSTAWSFEITLRPDREEFYA